MPVLDRYEVSRELGRGGMAVVYLARQTDLDRWVALKELHPEHRDPSVVRRLERESRLAGSLSHPNIVTVHDFFAVDGTGYIAMEYVPRGSLRAYVGGLEFAQVAGVLEGVLAALVCAERHGIVHRDLKPENVMVSAEGRVKLADFGIAKATGAVSMLTAAGTTLGTPHYMSPEQAMGQPVGPQSDLYSVGCMAYELVTGRLPFGDTDAPMAVLLRHINEPAPRATGVDPRLADWISVLMAKDPAARPASAADAWETLEELVLAVEGPRWRRVSALPDRDTEQVPGPFTPPPATALPADPIFHTFHAEPPTAAGGRRATAPAPRDVSPPAVETPPAVTATAADDGSRDVMPAGPLAAGTPSAVAPPLAPTGPLAAGTPSAVAPPIAPTGPLAAGTPAAVAPPIAPTGPLAARTPPARSPRPVVRRRRLALAAGAFVIVAAAGFAFFPRGHAPVPPPRVTHAVVAPSTPLAAGKVHVTLPPGWDALSLPISVPGLPRDGAAAPGGKEAAGVVFAGLAPRDAHNPALLSPKLGTPAAAPATVRLGTFAAYRHELRWHGRTLTVYAAPTSVGVATIACLSPAPDCRRIAESLQVPGAKGFPLGPDPTFASAATRALDIPARSLAAHTAKGQANTARTIAADYRVARTKLAHVKAGPADAPLRADLTRRLDRIADAYRDVAAAAAANARPRYASAATRAHTAEQALRDAVRKSVYRDAIHVARARTLPALRRPPVVVPKPTPVPREPRTPTPAPTPRPRAPAPTPVPTVVAPKPRPGPMPCDFDCIPTGPEDGGEG